uniref:Uncharacterized protein n=1 Tax=Oryctolagus cuniculus TaxID=9986 RepID=A0A5F9DFI5_RABIT
IKCFLWVIPTLQGAMFQFSMLKISQLLVLLLVCFLPGSKWVVSCKILFLIDSLHELSDEQSFCVCFCLCLSTFQTE